MLGFIRQAAALLFIVALPVALVTTNVRIVANESRVYEYAADTYDTPETTGIARSELLRASGELRDYFNNDDDTVFIRVDRGGESISLFNRQETAHLRDVKNIFQASFRVQEAAVIFVLAYVVAVYIWAREASLRTLATQILLSGLVGALAIGLVGAAAVTGFEGTWEQFHLVFFDNDLWRLDPDTDRLIQMFPEEFWRDVSLWIGIGTLAQQAALALVAAVYLGLTRNAEPSYDATLAHGVRA